MPLPVEKMPVREELADCSPDRQLRIRPDRFCLDEYFLPVLTEGQISRMHVGRRRPAAITSVAPESANQCFMFPGSPLLACRDLGDVIAGILRPKHRRRIKRGLAVSFPPLTGRGMEESWLLD